MNTNTGYQAQKTAIYQFETIQPDTKQEINILNKEQYQKNLIKEQQISKSQKQKSEKKTQQSQESENYKNQQDQLVTLNLGKAQFKFSTKYRLTQFLQYLPQKNYICASYKWVNYEDEFLSQSNEFDRKKYVEYLIKTKQQTWIQTILMERQEFFSFDDYNFAFRNVNEKIEQRIKLSQYCYELADAIRGQKDSHYAPDYKMCLEKQNCLISSVQTKQFSNNKFLLEPLLQKIRVKKSETNLKILLNLNNNNLMNKWKFIFNRINKWKVNSLLFVYQENFQRQKEGTEIQLQGRNDRIKVKKQFIGLKDSLLKLVKNLGHINFEGLRILRLIYLEIDNIQFLEFMNLSTLCYFWIDSHRLTSIKPLNKIRKTVSLDEDVPNTMFVKDSSGHLIKQFQLNRIQLNKLQNISLSQLLLCNEKDEIQITTNTNALAKCNLFITQQMFINKDTLKRNYAYREKKMKQNGKQINDAFIQGNRKFQDYLSKLGKRFSQKNANL